MNNLQLSLLLKRLLPKGLITLTPSGDYSTLPKVFPEFIQAIWALLKSLRYLDKFVVFGKNFYYIEEARCAVSRSVITQDNTHH